ncbi:MAG: NAD(P)-dependent oxidoreductase [Caldilineaceae bacterium]|nr:NAD(P)-dependent oxidoreductase [Caldilineaceae bacterium]
MHILITGISGRIGANLAKALLEAGHTVRGLIWEQDRRSEKLAGLPVELIEGTITNRAEVEQAVAGVDAICHLAAAFQGGGPFTNEQYFEINVRGTFNLLEAARQAAKPLQQFFYASTDAIYEKYLPGGLADPIREDTMKIAPGGQYALTKYLGEELALGYQRNYGLPVTVFRFALAVAGDEILNFPQFYLSHWLKTYEKLTSPEAVAVYQQLQALAPSDAAAAQRCLLLARDETGRSYKKHIADVRDIVQGFTDALGKPGAIGQVFQLAAPTPYTWEATIPYLAQKLGVDYVDVKLAGQVCTFYEFDMSKGQQRFGYQPRYDIFTMIEDALAFRQGQATGVIPTYV